MENEIEKPADVAVEETPEVTPEAPKQEETPEAKQTRLIRELKRVEKQNDLDSSFEEKKEEPEAKESKIDKKSDTELLDRVDKLSLQVAGVKGEKEIELFNKWKDRGFGAEEIVGDDIFQLQLEKIRTAAKNETATSDVKGGGGESKAKLESSYWINKGNPPTREDIPDRKTRVKIQRDFMANSKKGKTFYNE